MLPTNFFPTSEIPGGDSPLGSSLKLLNDGVSDPASPFADELKVNRSIVDLNGRVAVPLDVTGLPGSGNDLPPGLDTLVEELQSMQADLGPEALTAAELDVDLELTLRDLELPAGLNLESPLEPIEVAEINVSPIEPLPEDIAAASLDASVKLANPVSFVPPSASQINDLAELTNLSVEQLETTLDRVSQRLSQDDMRRVTETLQRLLAGTETGGGSRQDIAPARVVTVDGVTTDGRGDRFRALGVGPLGAELGERATVSSSLRTELGNAVAELARADAATLVKPQAGTFQVHATAAAIPTATQLATSADLASGLTALSETIDTPVRDPSWGDRLGERVLMMATNKLQNAEIRLSPAEMGPLRIRLSMEDNAANISFVAQNGATRDVIEAALPRLRNLLEEQGINLGQASVGEQSAEQQSENTDERQGSTALSTDDGDELSNENTVSVSTRVRVARGLLDTFV
ncbi:MAG: flagellar hook-length control protein FliK [Pseudomonadota bacterium]